MDLNQSKSATLEENLEKRFSNFSISPGLIKGLIGFTSLTTFGFGLRSAWKFSKRAPSEEISRIKIMSGVGFASKALTIATILTVSGFSLLVLGVAAAMNVNSPKQFGVKMKSLVGDSLRINKGDSGDNSIDSLTELFESVSESPKK